MFKAIIIDDEPKSIESIQYIIEKKCTYVTVVATARSADEAYEKIMEHSPDLIFLDVEMPYGSGFDLLNRFINPHFETIFVTAFDNFAIKAFKVDAIEYILKPFTETDIENAVKKATQRVNDKRIIAQNSGVAKASHASTPSKIAVPTFEGFTFITVSEIVRCEADENYTTFYLSDKSKLLVCKSLSDYEELLADFDFHRIHQSHLVNLAYIQKYYKGRGGYVVMSDGTHLDVSVRKKMEFLESILK